MKNKAKAIWFGVGAVIVLVVVGIVHQTNVGTVRQPFTKWVATKQTATNVHTNVKSRVMNWWLKQ